MSRKRKKKPARGWPKADKKPEPADSDGED